MSGGDVNHQSVRHFSAFVNYGFQIGTVVVCGEHSAAADIQKKEPPGCGYLVRSSVGWLIRYATHKKSPRFGFSQKD
jgi:hypothetical protein